MEETTSFVKQKALFSGLLAYSGLPLFWNFWKPGNVREFCTGQGKVRERAYSQRNVREFV